MHLLVVEGNTPEKNADILDQGGQTYSAIYCSVITAIMPAAKCQIIRPCEADPHALASQVDLATVSGAVWTGSSLNVYNGGSAVSNQISLFEQIYDTGVPIFGSCWGLQVMVTALGGRVRRNPKGRETGIARDIELTEAGSAHAMYRGKPTRFDAIATHTDAIEVLPNQCVALAENSNAIQAIALDQGDRSFWGVQYHPEFDLRAIALCMRRSAAELIAEGHVESSAELDAVCASFMRINENPQNSQARQNIYGIGKSVIDARIRWREVENWIETVALARKLPAFSSRSKKARATNI